MADPGEVVKAVSEDPGLLQRVIMVAIGTIGSLAAFVGRQAIKANEKEIKDIKGGITYLGDRFQALESRTDVIERDFMRSDKFDIQMQRMYEKIDANHRDVMSELLRRRENHRGGE